MKQLLMDRQAIEDLRWWIQQDRRLALKIVELLDELPANPYTGKGKPEPLKYGLSGY